MPRGGSRLAAPFGRRDLMLKCALALIGLTAVLINFGPSPAKSQTPSQAAPPAFNPGFADLMNTLVQPRHAKLKGGTTCAWLSLLSCYLWAAPALLRKSRALRRTPRSTPRPRKYS